MNEGDGWAGSGANPWHLDKKTQSTLFLSDESDKPARIGLVVTAGGVHYYLTSLSLGPHETRAIDLRQLRDAQVMDFRGHRIPAGASDGAVNWVRLEGVAVSGRLLVMRRAGGVASDYDCTSSYCPLYYKAISSTPIPLLATNGTLPDTATETAGDANGTDYYSDVTDASSWSSSDTSVATVGNSPPNFGLVTALTHPGTATISASYSDCGIWKWIRISGDCLCGLTTHTATQQATVASLTGPNTVWWFGGQTPSGYSTTVTLSAQPSGSSLSLCQILSGTDRAYTDGYPADNEVNITGGGPSDTANDVTVECQITSSSQDVLATHDLTVLAPQKLVPGYAPGSLPAFDDTASASTGYLTYATYTIEDNFSNLLPSPVPLAEFWSTAVTYDSPFSSSNCTWTRPDAQGYTTAPSTPAGFSDHIFGPLLSTNPTPTPTNPQAGNTKVFHWGQEWYGGSDVPFEEGVRAQTDTIQYYTDHGRHESITSPAP